MSTSSTYVKWAAVTLDFAIFSKMRFLSPWIGIRCSTPLEAAAETGGAATVVLTGPCAALRTSSSVRRPCGPLPRTAARFTLSSFARRRTAGAARTSPIGPGAGGGASVLAGAGGGAVGLAASGRVATASPVSPNTTSVEPTFTTSPSFARSWRIFPVTGEGIWTVTLSVMTSTTGSFSLTGSPSFTNHLTTSPSWTPSPMSGSLNSRAISVAKTEGDLTLCPVGGAAECEPFYGRQPIYVRGGVGRGGVAQTGGRDLCSALRAGSVPVLLLLSVRGTDLASSAWNHDIGCARRPGRVRHLPDRDRRVLREPRVLGAWGTDGRERLDAKRAAVRRDRHRPWDQRRGVVADAGMGLGP